MKTKIQNLEDYFNNEIPTLINNCRKIVKEISNRIAKNESINFINYPVTYQDRSVEYKILHGPWGFYSPWNDKLLEDCENINSKWYNVYLKIETKLEISDEILKPLLDDLNTPGYIANLHKLYEKASKGSDKDKRLFISACNFVGLLNETKEDWLKFKKSKVLISENEILIKINKRNQARLNKNYDEADKIRDELLDKGVLIEDKDGKTVWKFK